MDGIMVLVLLLTNFLYYYQSSEHQNSSVQKFDDLKNLIGRSLDII